jgi:hypothetical protein
VAWPIELVTPHDLINDRLAGRSVLVSF